MDLSHDDIARMFKRADEALRGQKANLADAMKDGRPDGVAAERWAYQILHAQMVAVLGPLGYTPASDT